MKKFVVYEIWTRSRVIEAETLDEAFMKGEPQPNAGYPSQEGIDDLSLSNWHATMLEDDGVVVQASAWPRLVTKE